MSPKFFAKPADWREWLEKYHAQEQELLVGFYKKDSGRPSITWPESVDVALCFGWIDGVRRRIDEERYSIRFTPRRARSIWSAVNIGRIAELNRLGLMHPSGAKAFEARQLERSAVYSFEQEGVAFEPMQQERFRSNKLAWKFFQTKAPWYRRAATWWVVSAKQQATRDKRLTALIECSERDQTIAHLTRKPVQKA